MTRTTRSLQAGPGWSPEIPTTARPRVAAASTPVAPPTPLRLRASLTVSRRNLLRNQQPPTRMPSGLTSVMPSTTQPWLHSARKNARMLTGSSLSGKKCSQSRRPRGKRCWLTSRTLPQAHAPPFEQLGARPRRPPAAVPTSTEPMQNLCAKLQLAADCGHTKGIYEGIKTATSPTSVKTAPLKSKTGEVITDQSMQLQRWWSIISTSTQPRTSSQTLPSMPCLSCQS